MLFVPVVENFEEISVRQEDADIRYIEIKVQLCISNGRFGELTDIMLVSRHQQLATAQCVIHVL